MCTGTGLLGKKGRLTVVGALRVMGGLGNEGCQSVPASGCNLIPTSVLQLGSNEQAELGRGGRKGHHCL